MNAVNATPHAELIAELMNPNNPKNEREHAAVREIERLREVQQAVNAADTAIVQILLPKLYSIIDRLLDKQDKAMVIEARRVLPKTYKNAFEKEKNA